MSCHRVKTGRDIAIGVSLWLGVFAGIATAQTGGPARPDQSPANRAPLSRLDPSTRMLVEMELRDATPQERAEWMTILNNIQPDQVSHLLQARRRAAMGRKPAPSPNSTQRPPIDPTPSVSATIPNPRRSIEPVDFVQQPEPLPVVAPVQQEPNSDDFRPNDNFPSITATPTTSPTVITEDSPPRQDRLPARMHSTTPRERDHHSFSPTSESSEPGSLPSTEESAPSAIRRALMTPLRPFRNESPPASLSPVTPSAAPPATLPATPSAIARSEPSSSQNRNQWNATASPFVDAELHRLISLLEAEAAQSPQATAPGDHKHLRRHVQLRMLRLLAGEPERALEAIPGIEPAEQEMWTHLLWTLANEMEASPDRPRADRIARSAELLAEAERHLRNAAALQISPVCFCHKINSFGSYERFLRDEFRPGQPVLVYAELRNFTSELTPDGQYRTRLRTDVEIHSVDETNTSQVVERRDFPATQDLCRSPRLDYFHSYRLDLPAHLTAGRYTLRLTITDELSGKTSTTDLPFALR